jgi:hypothetical protein
MTPKNLSINSNLFFQGLQNNSFRQNDKLVQFKFLWLHLSKLTQNIGRSMGFTYAMFTLYCNVVMVIASYVFLVLIRNGFHKHILGQTVGILVSLATLYAQCTNAQSATEEVSSHKWIYFVIIYGLLFECRPLTRHRRLLSATVFRLHPLLPTAFVGFIHKIMCLISVSSH